MDMYRSSSVVRTVLALTVVALCISAGTAYGAGVQVSLASSFTADDVLRYSGAYTTPGISWDNPGAGGSVDNWLLTQSAANQLAASQGGSAVGINDTGLYPASGARLYDVQLGFTNATPTGANVVIRSTNAGSFSFSVPGNYYSQFAIFGSSGSGSTSLTITLNYSTGSATVLSDVTLPDWYSGNPGNTAAGAAGTSFALTPAMSRQAAYSFPSGGYQVPNVSGSGAYIYGVNLAPDSTRQLTSVSVAYAPASPGYTVANFLTAAGALAAGSTNTNPVATAAPALGAWGLVLLAAGLGLVFWLSLRRRHQTL
jgi:hypothetical protein